MASTLFAFCVLDGEEDTLLDLLDDVLDAGVEDAEWEWLSWTDAKGRIFAVVKGSLAARGAFLGSDNARPIRLSKAHQFAADNRAEWDEPKSASEGREVLDQWMRDPGITPLDGEVIAAALPKAEPAVPASPLVLQGRARLERNAIPIDTSTPVRNSPQKNDSSGHDHGRSRQSGPAPRKARQASREGTTNSVIAAFGMAMAGQTDSTGQKFSLYRMEASEDED